MADGPVLLAIDPDWPQWRKDEVNAVNDRKVSMWEASEEAINNPQAHVPTGKSDLQKSREAREVRAEAARAAAAAEKAREAAAARAASDVGSVQRGGRARDRAKTQDEIIQEMSTGQSTDSNN